jgi:uncharacterized protein (DUF3820 family)
MRLAGDIWLRFSLRPVEAKLLALALDPAARGNEISTSAAKLINLLRARGVSAAEMLYGSTPTSTVAGATLARALATCMPFEKYRDHPLSDVPLSYLRWMYDNCRNTSAGLRNAITIILEGD